MKTYIKASPDGKKFAMERDGIVLACPFKTSVPVPDRMGNPNFIEQTCSSSCPFFELTETKETKRVFLHCVTGSRIINISEKETEAPRILHTL